MQNFKKLIFLLTSQELKSASFLLLMVIIMALLEMIGVASILPFIAVITNPEIVESNSILNKIYLVFGKYGVENIQQFLFVLGICLFVLFVISLTVKAVTYYLQVRFVQMCEYKIGKRLVEGYLHQPYSWFLNRHSAELGKTILSEISRVISGAISPMMDLISRGMLAIAIIFLLIIVDPKLALIVGMSLASAYGLIFYFIRNYLKRIGKESLRNNELRFTAISEAFGASKEIKVGGFEQTYIRRFSQAAKIFAQNIAYAQITSQLPRFILEAIAFGGILLIVLYKMGQTDSFNNALPIISLYVFAGYRLMPALQQIYTSFTSLTFSSASLDKLYNDIKSLKPYNINPDQNFISLNQGIILKNVHYKYPDASRSSLEDISLNIPVKTTVGLVGATGSGKTTTIDIILGLFEAQKGTLEVDGKIITKENSRSWQKSIGYVPQHIYLSDGTIAANIAFCVDSNDINQEAVEKAAKIANIHDFISEELPKQYQTTIGERGIRLSGGQRQRIGIARALYNNPLVLVLDEATSALDNQTEKVVMEAINNLGKNLTIILIAHRLSTVKNCDKIFLLEKGQLKNEGTFKELVKYNIDFGVNANDN